MDYLLIVFFSVIPHIVQALETTITLDRPTCRHGTSYSLLSSYNVYLLKPRPSNDSKYWWCSVKFRSNQRLCATMTHFDKPPLGCPYTIALYADTGSANYDCYQHSDEYWYGSEWQYCTYGKSLTVRVTRLNIELLYPDFKNANFSLYVAKSTHITYGDYTRRTTRKPTTTTTTTTTEATYSSTDDNTEFEFREVLSVGAGIVVSVILIALMASCFYRKQQYHRSRYAGRVSQHVTHQSTVIHPMTTVSRAPRPDMDPPSYASVCQQNSQYPPVPPSHGMYIPYPSTDLTTNPVEPSAPPPYSEKMFTDSPPPPYPDTERY